MACGAKDVYGRAKGTVRSKAEPWNERCTLRVKNVSLGTKGDTEIRVAPRSSVVLNPPVALAWDFSSQSAGLNSGELVALFKFRMTT